MRSFALILTLGGAGLAHADDIDNWGVRCLNEKDTGFRSIACQGFRAGYTFHERQQAKVEIATGQGPAKTPVGIIPDFGGLPLGKTEPAKRYLQSYSEAMDAYADMLQDGTIAPAGRIVPSPGFQAINPEMFKFDDPTGKPIIDF